MISKNMMINRIEIKNRCLRSEDGQKRLNKVSLVQILNLIKYERRKKYMFISSGENLLDFVTCFACQTQ
jgi:hypothetical protein